MGQFSEHKGIRVLLEAFKVVSAKFPNARLLVAAPISDAYALETIDDWAGAVKAGSIIFLGAVEDVPGLLQVCHVHVAPTLKPEPYGLVAIEAKEAGLPSIVFAEGGLGELVINGVDGIALSEKSPMALANAMMAYCGEPERARADGVRARDSLTKRLYVDRHDEAWEQIYIETAKRDHWPVSENAQ